ncbi:MAG: hypothetical protein GXX82_10590 [Syntrophorhabdus sp.]|jgi:hypothetical protein|nr:hypothetical protein [Syntrophorhabdus sp.]
MGTNDNIEIRPKYQNLIPKLAKHEFEKLEASILAEGIREPLTIAVIPETNHGITTTARVLLDGHHRHAIAREHGLPFTTREIEFPDEDAAIIWMIDCQLGRRNIIHALDRVILLEKKRPILEKRAQERQRAGKAEGDLALETTQGGAKGKRTRRPTVTEQLAKEAGMGRTNYDACLNILARGIPALIKFVREGDMSISAAGTLLAHTPGRGIMNDDEHRAWQQQLVDNVGGTADAMQAVVRKVNCRARESDRECKMWEREAERERLQDEKYQVDEERDEEEIERWREEREAPHEEQTEPEEVEETEPPVVREEEEDEEQETRGPSEQEREVIEIHRKALRERQELVSGIVSGIVGAAESVLAARGLRMPLAAQEVLANVVEAWTIEHIVNSNEAVLRARAAEKVS